MNIYIYICISCVLFFFTLCFFLLHPQGSGMEPGSFLSFHQDDPHLRAYIRKSEANVRREWEHELGLWPEYFPKEENNPQEKNLQDNNLQTTKTAWGTTSTTATTDLSAFPSIPSTRGSMAYQSQVDVGKMLLYGLTHTCTHTHTHMHLHALAHTHIHLHIHLHIHTCTLT